MKRYVQSGCMEFLFLNDADSSSLAELISNAGQETSAAGASRLRIGRERNGLQAIPPTVLLGGQECFEVATCFENVDELDLSRLSFSPSGNQPNCCSEHRPLLA